LLEGRIVAWRVAPQIKAVGVCEKWRRRLSR
jgi:hypothetical protein